MPTKYSIIPLIRLKRVPILNVKDQTIELRDIRNLYPRGEAITFTDDGRPFDTQIRDKIRELVEVAFEEGKHGIGLNGLLDLDESPPRFIQIDADPSEWLNPPNLVGKYVISKLDYGSYDVDMIEGKPLSQLTFIRVFLSAPSAICYNNCEYYKQTNTLTFDYEGKETQASCAFQYFHETYGKMSNYSKYCGSTKSKGITCPVKKMKYWSQTDPPWFGDWLSLYKSHKFTETFDRSKIKALPDWGDIGERLKDAQSRMKELEVIEYKPPNYTKEQKYNSMTLLEIVKLCMWMRLNLVIYDDRNQHFLSYFDKQFEKPDTFKKRKQGGIAVRVIDNHAYFVKDANITISALTRQMAFDGISDHTTAPMKDKSNDQPSKNWKDAEWIFHPKVKVRQGIHTIDWGYYLANCGEKVPTSKDFDDIKNHEIEEMMPTHPPPTPASLKACASDEDATIYWVGQTSLNGVVKLLMNNYKMKPDNMRGLAHTIKRATYGNLMIMAEDQYPESKYPHNYEGTLDDGDPDVFVEEEKACLETWRKDYPDLETMAIPSAMKISNAIYDKNYEGREYLSAMNLQVRKIFYEGEVKADFRKFSGKDRRMMFSLDLKKAYSNSMKFMDCDWCVYDAIDQPKQFRKFKDDAFYLCRETRKGYPFKEVKGLVLYHGCLLRHLIGQGVIPVYIIDSQKKLPKDHFSKFVDICYDSISKNENGYEEDFVNGKQLVNTFVGELKKRDGINDYKLWINSDPRMAVRNLLNGLCVSNLSGQEYRKSVYLSSQPQAKYNFMTGQPIRLQIMEKINEMNLLVYQSYRALLWFNRKLNNSTFKSNIKLVKTDALYLSYPMRVDYYKDTNSHFTGLNSETREKFDPHQYSHLINELLPEGFSVAVESEIIRPSILNEYQPSSGQLPIMMRANKWNQSWRIDKHWTKKQARPILKSALSHGGANFTGRAGTGKTELCKELDKWTKENRKNYRWVKMMKKLLCGDKYYEECQLWRDKHPCLIEKFALTNKATNHIGGKTFHKGLGIPFSIAPCETNDGEEELEEEEVRPVDFMEKIIQRLEGDGKSKPRTDIFVADEISMVGGDLWSILCYIKLRIPTMRFLLFGDIEHQLPPVGEETRNFIYARAIKEIVNYNQIEMIYNFRQGDGSGALWDDWSLHPKRFKTDPEDPDTQLNLCYENKTRKKVIEYHQDKLVNPLVLECSNENDYNSKRGQTKEVKVNIGTPMIARKSNKELGFAKNEMFIVMDYNDVDVKLFKKTDTSDQILMDHKEFMANFVSGYCITIHKSQGDTYEEKYTIWDWDKISAMDGFNQNRKLRYVAQSRSKKPDENIFYK